MSKSLNVNNTIDNRVVLNSNLKDILKESFTIEFYAKIIGTNKRQIVVSNYSLETDTISLGIEISVENKVRLYTCKGHVNEFYGPLAQNKWIHFAVAYNKELSNITLYVDGQVAINSPQTESLYSSLNMMLGCDHRLSMPLDGKIAEFKMYNYARSKEEIGKEFNRKIKTPYQNSLVAYLDFESITNRTIHDKSMYKNHAEANNLNIANEGPSLVYHKYLIQANERYYSLNQDSYIDGTYAPIDKETVLPQDVMELGFESLTELSTDITIGDETFRPIDKFDNFNVVFSYGDTIEKCKLNIKGLRKSNVLIVANGDISKVVCSHIHYFELAATASENSKIKIAVSNDSGNTWYTTSNNGASWTNLNINIPLKSYASLDESEKEQWDLSKRNILDLGIDHNALRNVDFNTLSGEKIRFAYVIERSSYSDNAYIDTLRWQFDAKGFFRKLKDSEVDIDVYENAIKVTPQINTDILKINIMN